MLIRLDKRHAAYHEVEVQIFLAALWKVRMDTSWIYPRVNVDAQDFQEGWCFVGFRLESKVEEGALHLVLRSETHDEEGKWVMGCDLKVNELISN